MNSTLFKFKDKFLKVCQHGAPQWVVSSVSKRKKVKFGAAFTVCSRSERSHVHITGTYNSEESQRTSRDSSGVEGGGVTNRCHFHSVPFNSPSCLPFAHVTFSVTAKPTLMFYLSLYVHGARHRLPSLPPWCSRRPPWTGGPAIL